MQRVNGVVWGCFSGAHHQEVFTASFEMWLTALVAVREVILAFPTLLSSSTSIAEPSPGPLSLVLLGLQEPPISEEHMTLLTATTVQKSILDGFRALGIATCGRFSSLADDLPDLREALSEMFNVDKKHGPLHRLEASKLVEV